MVGPPDQGLWGCLATALCGTTFWDLIQKASMYTLKYASLPYSWTYPLSKPRAGYLARGAIAPNSESGTKIFQVNQAFDV